MAYRGQPPSFKTDVHRAPTKKWADAKSYSYEGDEWGGYDEFGEYEDPAPPLPKATGFRQRGQVLPAVDTSAGAGPSASTAPPFRGRSDSFEAGDETRNFSAGAPPRPPGNGGSPMPGDMSNRVSSATSKSAPGASDSTYAEGYQPQPSGTRSTSQDVSGAGPPVDPATGGFFPPRKSSLTTGRPTDLPIGGLPPREDSLPPAPAADSTVAPATAATEPSVAKPAFIRPADIYKRMQEEKEKERRSMDSNRSSMESMSRSIRDDRYLSGNSQARESSGSPARLGSSLQTVPERKSEYGMDGFSIHDPSSALAPAPATATQAFSPSATEEEQRSSTDSYAASTAESTDGPSAPVVIPSLPQLNRFSGFGSDFWGSSSTGQEPPSLAQEASTMTTMENTRAIPTLDTSEATKGGDSNLTEPSQGIRSAVGNAFEPQTPMSVQGSQRSATDSEFSSSNNTTGISPIMSRVPSAATALRNAQAKENRPAPPMITEEEHEATSSDSRPTSATTLKAPDSGASRGLSVGSDESAVSGQTRDLSGNPASAPTHAFAVQTGHSVPEGSVAEVNVPSPSSNYTYSPSNDTPVERLQGQEYYQQQDGGTRDIPQSAIETSHSATAEPQPGAENASTITPTAVETTSAQPSVERSSGTVSPSPSKGRVKDLASRYDIIHSSRQNSFDSATGSPSRSMSPANLTAALRTTQQESSNEGNLDGSSDMQRGAPSSESTEQHDASQNRPQLPGAWVSYAESTQSSEAQDESSMTYTPDDMRARSREASPIRDQPREAEVDLTPSSNVASPSGNPTEGPMAAVAAAGNAIAESLMSTVGMNRSPSDNEGAPSASDRDITPEGDERGTRDLQPNPLVSQTVVDTSNQGPTSNDEYLNAPAPLRQRSPSPSPIDTSVGPGVFNESSGTGNMSWGSSPDDSENDRIAKDIERTLNVSNEEQSQTVGDKPDSVSPGLTPTSPNDNAMRESTVLPREYDSYWASTSNFRQSSANIPGRETESNTATPTQPAPPSPQVLTSKAFRSSPVSASHSPKPTMLKKRFSWEEEDDGDEDEENGQTVAPEGLGILQTSAADQEAPVSDAGFTSERELQPSQPAIVTHQGSEAEPDEPSSAYSIPEIRFGDEDEPVTSARGLTLMEPVEEETKAEANDSTRFSDDTMASEEQVMGRTSKDGPSSDNYEAATAMDRSSQLKLAPFKEIMAMSQPSQRIQAYNETKDGFAVVKTGLNDWLAHMMAAYPEHAQIDSSSPKPTVNTSGLAGSVRTKLSPSVAKLMSPSGSQPYYQQYLDSAGPLPTVSTQPASSSSPGQVDAGAKNRSSSGQMQGKGKDLLHSAGVLGGKASTGAKGLFAKGKSKFRTASSSEKDRSSRSEPSPSAAAVPSLQPPPPPAKDVNLRPADPQPPYAQSGSAKANPKPPPPPSSPSDASAATNNTTNATSEASPDSAIERPRSGIMSRLFQNRRLSVPLSPSERDVSQASAPDEQAASASALGIRQDNADESTAAITTPTQNRGTVVVPVVGSSVPSNPSEDKDPTANLAPPPLSVEEAEFITSQPQDQSVPHLAPEPTSTDHPVTDDPVESETRNVVMAGDESFRTAPSVQDAPHHANEPPSPGNDTKSFDGRDIPIWDYSPPEDLNEHSQPPQLQSSEIHDFAEAEANGISVGPGQGQGGEVQAQPLDSSSPALEVGSDSLAQATTATAPFPGQLDQSLAVAAVNAKDLGHQREPSLGDAKEIAVEPHEIHPAMRDDASSASSIRERKQESTETSARLGQSADLEKKKELGHTTPRLDPSVDLDTLPPSVQKRYMQSMHNESRGSNTSLPRPREYDSSRNESPARHSYAPWATDQQSQASSSRNSPFRGGASFEIPSRGSPVSSPQIRGNSIEYQVPGIGPPAETDTDFAAELAEPRSKSPFARFRNRSRPGSAGGPSSANPSATDLPVGQVDEGKTAKRRSMPTWAMVRPRGREASVVFDGKTDENAAPADTQPERPTSKQTQSPWRRFRSRSRGAEDVLEPTVAPTGAEPESPTAKRRSQSPWKRLRGGSRDAEEVLEKPAAPAMAAETERPTSRRNHSPWQKLRRSSRGAEEVLEPQAPPASTSISYNAAQQGMPRDAPYLPTSTNAIPQPSDASASRDPQKPVLQMRQDTWPAATAISHDPYTVALPDRRRFDQQQLGPDARQTNVPPWGPSYDPANRQAVNYPSPLQRETMEPPQALGYGYSDTSERNYSDTRERTYPDTRDRMYSEPAAETKASATKQKPATLQRTPRARDTNTNKRNSFFGGLFSSSKAEPDQQKRPNRLSKALRRQSQPVDLTPQKERIDISTGQRQREPRQPDTQSGKPRPPLKDAPADASTQTEQSQLEDWRYQRHQQLEAAIRDQNRESHLQYLQTQGIIPARAPSATQASSSTVSAEQSARTSFQIAPQPNAQVAPSNGPGPQYNTLPQRQRRASQPKAAEARARASSASSGGSAHRAYAYGPGPVKPSQMQPSGVEWTPARYHGVSSFSGPAHDAPATSAGESWSPTIPYFATQNQSQTQGRPRISLDGTSPVDPPSGYQQSMGGQLLRWNPPSTTPINEEDWTGPAYHDSGYVGHQGSRQPREGQSGNWGYSIYR